VFGSNLVMIALSSGAAVAAPMSSVLDSNDTPLPCPEPVGARLHDGFFARSESGLAGFWSQVSGSRVRTGIRGIGQSAVLSIGGTPLPGVVLGGTLWTARLDPVFEYRGVTTVPDDDSVKITQLRVGPFVDIYPNPRRGLHAQASATLALQIESDIKGDPIEPMALGAASSLGVGYEWFLSPDFSLGFMARASFGYLVRAPASATERMPWIVPELALTATYH
jgi:hypothetical protein